jgi:hypothetical protein
VLHARRMPLAFAPAAATTAAAAVAGGGAATRVRLDRDLLVAFYGALFQPHNADADHQALADSAVQAFAAAVSDLRRDRRARGAWRAPAPHASQLAALLIMLQCPAFAEPNAFEHFSGADLPLLCRCGVAI